MKGSSPKDRAHLAQSLSPLATTLRVLTQEDDPAGQWDAIIQETAEQ